MFSFIYLFTCLFSENKFPWTNTDSINVIVIVREDGVIVMEQGIKSRQSCKWGKKEPLKVWKLLKTQSLNRYWNKKQYPSLILSKFLYGNKKVFSSIQKALSNQSSNSKDWLDRWRAAKSWESKLIKEFHTDPSSSPLSRRSEDLYNNIHVPSQFFESESVKVRKNNVSTRISPRPSSMLDQINRSSFSSFDPNSNFLGDESSKSTSPISSSVATPLSSNKPGYMNLTESVKAKQRVCKHNDTHLMRKGSMEELQTHDKIIPLSNGKARRSVGSLPSLATVCCNDLYPPIQVEGFDWVKYQRGWYICIYQVQRLVVPFLLCLLLLFVYLFREKILHRFWVLGFLIVIWRI